MFTQRHGHKLFLYTICRAASGRPASFCKHSHMVSGALHTKRPVRFANIPVFYHRFMILPQQGCVITSKAKND